MKKYIPLILCAFVLTTVISSCKKDAVKKTFLITSFNDSTTTLAFTYDVQGNVTRLVNNGYTIDFFYNNNKLVKRTKASSGTNEGVDSAYYNGSGQLYKTVSFDNTNTKTQTTQITYNGDNTVNTVTVDYESATADELYEFTYSGGKLVQRNKSAKDGAVYKLANKIEFLGYDDKANPLRPLYEKSLIDIQEAFAYFISYPNNFTSVKSTSYDTNGLVTNVYSASASYTYNADGLPVTATFTEGSTTSTYTLTYTEF